MIAAEMRATFDCVSWIEQEECCRRRRVCSFTLCPLIGELSSVAKLQTAILFSQYSQCSLPLASYILWHQPLFIWSSVTIMLFFHTSLSSCGCRDVYGPVATLTAAFTLRSLRNHEAIVTLHLSPFQFLVHLLPFPWAQLSLFLLYFKSCFVLYMFLCIFLLDILAVFTFSYSVDAIIWVNTWFLLFVPVQLNRQAINIYDLIRAILRK